VHRVAGGWFTRLLDLVVVTRLMSQVWVDDGRAEQVFGDRAQPLASAMLHARAEAQVLAERVLTVEQLAMLESLLLDWRTENRGMVRASFVRFSNFAIGRGRSAASEVLAARGYFAEVGQAGQAVDEARLLGERMFYQVKRTPTLLRWQVAAAKDDLLATPEVASALADLHRLTDQAEQLPAHITAEREAVLAAVDSRMARVDAIVANVKDLIAETTSLVAALEPTSRSLDQLLKTADALFARYDAWYRWGTDINEIRPFDVREYTEIVRESATTTQSLNELVNSSNDLLASQSQLLLNDFFRRVYLALFAMFALLVGYRVISLLLMRRLATHGTVPGALPSRQALGRAKG
jgi:hypothetical protein